MSVIFNPGSSLSQPYLGTLLASLVSGLVGRTWTGKVSLVLCHLFVNLWSAFRGERRNIVVSHIHSLAQFQISYFSTIHYLFDSKWPKYLCSYTSLVRIHKRNPCCAGFIKEIIWPSKCSFICPIAHREFDTCFLGSFEVALLNWLDLPSVPAKCLFN